MVTLPSIVLSHTCGGDVDLGHPLALEVHLAGLLARSVGKWLPLP